MLPTQCNACVIMHPHAGKWLSALLLINPWISMSRTIDWWLNSQFKLSSWVHTQGWHEPWALVQLNYILLPINLPQPSVFLEHTHFPHPSPLYTSLSMQLRCWYKQKSCTPHRSQSTYAHTHWAHAHIHTNTPPHTPSFTTPLWKSRGEAA